MTGNVQLYLTDAERTLLRMGGPFAGIGLGVKGTQSPVVGHFEIWSATSQFRHERADQRSAEGNTKPVRK